MKRVLGIDLGDARTGLAVSDELRMLAHPLETIESNSAETVAQRIRAIMSEKDIDCVVVGLPRNMDGSLGKSAEQAQRFVEKLNGMISCQVVTWDERLSTVAADRALQAAGKKTRETRNIRDQVAAQIILQSYLDRLSA
jgi:putative Holliday junction resolvase